jgi:diphthamide synthase subunit DPH2
VAPAGQLSMPKLELQMPNPYKPEITNYKHQITNKFQISKKIKTQLFGILNFGYCDLFDISDLLFEIFSAET